MDPKKPPVPRRVWRMTSDSPQGEFVDVGSGPIEAPEPRVVKRTFHPEVRTTAAKVDPPVAEGGRIRDPLRMDYLQKHLRAVREAIDKGCDIRGYMCWSLLDNLEWSLGYSKRFGIVHVNYGTLERTPKDSAKWYSGVVASHGGTLDDPLPY